MERPLVSQIYAYVVCLIAIVVGLASLAGFVGSAFRVGNPAAGPHVMIARTGFHRFGGGSFAPRNMAPMPPLTMPPGSRIAAPGGRFLADARYTAVSRLVTNLVLLLAAIALLGWHWRWLHGPPRAAA